MSETELKQIIDELLSKGNSWQKIGSHVLSFCGLIQQQKKDTETIKNIKTVLKQYDNNDKSYRILMKLLDEYKTSKEDER